MISQEAIQNMPKKEADFVSIIYFLLRHSVGFFIKRIWVKRVVGIKNIPKDGPAIIVFNHQSYFDFLTFAAVAPRNVHFLSAEKFFEDKWWKPLMKFTGQIRVNRSSSDKEVVHNAVSEHLKKEKIIGIFPEGTRSPHKHMMLPGFTGAAKYALLHKIQIIPVGIRGAYDILPRDKKYPRFRKHIEIHVGKPIHFSEIHHDILTHKIMRELEKLSGRDYPYDMADKEIKKREGIIILDMDNTLLRGQSQEHLIKYLREIGLINSYKALVILGWFILYSLHLTNNTTRITEYVLSNFKNKNFDEIDNIINTFFETKLKKNIYKDGIKLVNDLKKDGRKIILVSAAINPIVSRFAKEIGIDEYLCTQIEVKNGVFTGRIEGVPIHGEEKVSAICGYKIDKNISFEKSEAYTDSISDLSLLRLVGKPIVVNPDRKLLKKAKKENWSIVHLK